MSGLPLSLLGAFEAKFDGTPLAIPRNKAKALLAMPLGKIRSKDELCALLWSDHPLTESCALAPVG